jgi:hypothetical protein
MNKFLGHLSTVTTHRHIVFVNCVKCGIPFRGLIHDLSKFSPVEFFNGVRYFSDGRKSPNVAERSDKGYSAAWLHHKGRNKHHFEYWTEFNFRGSDVYACKMPLVYVKEMFCDRVAATKTYLKDEYTDFAPLEYYLSRRESRFLHPDTAEILGRLLVMLAADGEKKVFAYIRRLS